MPGFNLDLSSGAMASSAVFSLFDNQYMNVFLSNEWSVVWKDRLGGVIVE